jgi:exopolyphosphatase / guanosine-5'-triphosphate,3'-diphosphate pyrophosphatase
LACLVRFHRRKIKPEDFPDFYLYSAQDLRYALVIFRLAILLNQKRRDDMLPQLHLTAGERSLQLQLPNQWTEQQTVLVADLITEQQFLKRLDFTLECPGVPKDILEE